MNFQELHSFCTAIRIQSFSFDYFSRRARMEIFPDYGASVEVKDKRFFIEFSNCVYIHSLNTSSYAETGETEFISWGVSTELPSAVLNSTLSKTIHAGFTSFGFNRISKEKIDKECKKYFFENTLGDAIYIICSKIDVKEKN